MIEETVNETLILHESEPYTITCQGHDDGVGLVLWSNELAVATSAIGLTHEELYQAYQYSLMLQKEVEYGNIHESEAEG